MTLPQFDLSDPYAVLGVPPHAATRQIKILYFNLAQKYHPYCLTLHLNKDDGHRMFVVIGNAYKILGNTERRTQHDEAVRVWCTPMWDTK